MKQERLTAKKLFIEEGHTDKEWNTLIDKTPWELLVKERIRNNKLQLQIEKMNLKYEKVKLSNIEPMWGRTELKTIHKLKETIAAYKITMFIRTRDKIQRDVICASREVYKILGWGYNEKVFQESVKRELEEKGYRIITEVPRTLTYKGFPLGDGVYVRTDMVVQSRNGPNKSIILELKVDQGSIGGVKKAKQQLIRYLSNNVNAGKRGIVIIFPDRAGETVKFQSCI